MTNILSILFIMSLAILSMVPLRKLARQKGETARTWELGLLLVWGFLWIGLRLAKNIFLSYLPHYIEHRVGFWFVFLLSCTISYVAVYARLLKRPTLDHWQKKMEEIGKD